MSLKVMAMATPNPNAKKFILNIDVKDEGKATFSEQNESEHVPLAWELLNIPCVKSVHFFENVITITQDGSRDWDELSEQVEGTLYSLAPEHNPSFRDAEQQRRQGLTDELRTVEDILDRTIRPYLQGDGGDLEVLALQDDVLSIRYQGACGTCPSSMAGTLHAIQSVLQDEFRENLEVVIA